MGPSRRWRPLIVAAAVFLAGYWFLFRDGSDDGFLRDSYKPGQAPLDAGVRAPPPNAVRWKKLEDKNPVTSLYSLPAPTAGSGSAPSIPAIQKTPPPAESDQARKLRLSRLAAVKESFVHSWAGYKAHAWLHDEVLPISGQANDPFGGWAATLVDALDTLWIMGLKADFDRAVAAVDKIDFSYSHAENINVFETTIRYLGGFLAAYELSGKKHRSLLHKAAEVGELLLCAFDTPNRMPISRWNWADYTRGAKQTAPPMMLLSELGSFSLEFTKLSQLTGDMRFYDAAQRVADELERSQQKTKLPGMWPILVNAAELRFDVDRTFTLGGMSDSLYEYLPKQYLLLGGALQQPRAMYEGFIEAAKKHLFRRILNRDNLPLVASGDAYVSGTIAADGSDAHLRVTHTAKMQHLTCFVGGMVGISARAFSRPDDLELAAQITDSCVWSYNSTASGIGPEIYSFTPCGGISDSPTGTDCVFSEQKWLLAVSEYMQLEDGTDRDGLLLNTVAKRRLPPGMTDVNDRKYILRPEAIESVFIMYRLTGDPQWMDKAWDMFSAVEKHTRTELAAASLDDVTRSDPHKTDSMESFWLAETLKYFYLVFAEWDVLDLDQWVLNTEAHPLRRADA